MAATIGIRVELPAYSQSFHIQVDSQWSIREVKGEIQRSCKGSPRVEGQRLIWRGRFLRDEESVKDIWKVRTLATSSDALGLTFVGLQSADDARIVHLSVNPTAWSSSPPVAPAPSPTTPTAPMSMPPSASRRDSVGSSRSQPQVVPPTPTPLAFILNRHNTAIHVLTHGSLPTSPALQADPASREYAVGVLEMYGFAWPTILNEEYPPNPEPGQGVKYEQVVLE